MSTRTHTQVIITCERDRYEAKVEEGGSNGAFQTSGQYDTPLGAVVSLAASLFDNWMDEMHKREKLEQPTDQLVAQYVFRNGREETRVLQAKAWPAEVLVQVHPPDGPPRDVRLLQTDDYEDGARIYREDEAGYVSPRYPAGVEPPEDGHHE